MRTVRLAALACAIGLLVPFVIHAAGSASPVVPEHLRAGVDAAQDTGLLLYRHDHAALVASDLLPVVPAEPGLRQKIDGWITTPAGDRVRVIFHDDADPARAVYIIDVDDDGGSATMQAPDDGALDADAIALVRARRAAIAASWGRCSRNYNTVVLHRGGEVHAYLMPWLDEVIPAGGHHLFVYDAQGRDLLRRRSFTSGCMDLAFRDTLPDGPPRAELVSHALDPHPTEIHVYVSLRAPAALGVITAGEKGQGTHMAWELDHGRIRLAAIDLGGD